MRIKDYRMGALLTVMSMAAGLGACREGDEITGTGDGIIRVAPLRKISICNTVDLAGADKRYGFSGFYAHFLFQMASETGSFHAGRSVRYVQSGLTQCFDLTNAEASGVENTLKTTPVRVLSATASVNEAYGTYAASAHAKYLGHSIDDGGNIAVSFLFDFAHPEGDSSVVLATKLATHLVLNEVLGIRQTLNQAMSVSGRLGGKADAPAAGGRTGGRGAGGAR